MSPPSDFEDLLRIYYKRLFPYDPYVRWVGAGHAGAGAVDAKAYLARREFSFTLKDDIYLRYLSFSTAEELKQEMVKKLPHKIDLGAVYNSRPTDHLKVRDFQPVEKELVFDIDMTDYDEVRSCCEGAKICDKCWRFMTVALKVLDRALREDFGFKHLLWVYSGRRGIHCWVSDPQAKRLGQAARSAVAEYLQLLTGGEGKTKKVNLRGSLVHPSIEKALEIVKEAFPKLCLEDQDILGDKESWEKVLVLIPSEEVRSAARREFVSLPNSTKRWEMLTRLVLGNSGPKDRFKDPERTLSEIMLQFVYPRLDIAVSKGLNHLLKSPFCVHPKTGRVCIPIDPSKADQFDPSDVPTLRQLTDEIDAFAKNEEADGTGAKGNISKEYKKTSLREPMKIFDKFLSGLSETWRGKNMEASDASMEF